LSEWEKAILAHPAVLEAGVIPVPDEKWGEVPKALVVLKPNAAATESELIDFCRTRLAHYKCPRSFEFVDSLPKTGTGKILKKDIRKKYWHGQSTLRVQLTAANGRLTGEKLFVSDAGVADFILVVARNGVFIVDAKANGLKISPMSGMDLTRKLYAVEFKDTPAEHLGPATNLPRAFDIASAALSAELVGGMQRTLDLTVEYAKTRKQFGKPIGMFQAVQHQCADMYLETESSRSAVYYAGWALEENAPDASTAVSIAKMYSSDAARTVGNRGIQIHGGMGFTWENDLHLYYRRAKASENGFGDATFHRERIASLVIDAAGVTAKSA
jgi:alkylation response protein AidB-like acyl-CoA dehydrogenase